MGRSRLSLPLLALLVTAGCDDREAVKPEQSAADAGLDASAPLDAGAQPDAGMALLPTAGTWRLAMAFPDLGLRLGGVLGIRTDAGRLHLTLALVAPDGATVSDVLAEVADVPVGAGGDFTLAIEVLTIPAEFSPTGGALDVALTLDGQVRGADFLCGAATGNVPALMLDLGEGTFGAVPEGAGEPPDGCEATPVDPMGLTVGGERPARVLLPAAYAEDGPAWPLVLLLHGFGSNGAQQNSYLQIGAHQDALGFVLVVPDGTENPDGERFWNATLARRDDFGSGVTTWPT
ncbi:MAG: hypothetical protein R3F43_13445 [bacterium]